MNEVKEICLFGETKKELLATTVRCLHFAAVSRVDFVCCEIEDEKLVGKLDEAIGYADKLKDVAVELLEMMADE